MTDRLRKTLRMHRHLRSERVLCRQDGQPLTESALPGSARAGRTRSESAGKRAAYVAAHVLFAPGDAWGASESDSRTGRTS